MSNTDQLAVLMAKLEREAKKRHHLSGLPGGSKTGRMTEKARRAAQCLRMLDALEQVCMTGERYDKMHCNRAARDAVADVLALEGERI